MKDRGKSCPDGACVLSAILLGNLAESLEKMRRFARHADHVEKIRLLCLIWIPVIDSVLLTGPLPADDRIEELSALAKMVAEVEALGKATDRILEHGGKLCGCTCKEK